MMYLVSTQAKPPNHPMLIAIGNENLCQQAKELFNATPTKITNADLIYKADKILLLQFPIETFRTKYPEVFYEADILSLDTLDDDHLITSTSYPKYQLKELPVFLVLGPESVNLHEPVVFSNDKSKYISADEFKPLSQASNESELWIDETITHHLSPKELYKIFEKSGKSAHLIVDEENADAYERFFGFAMPIKQKR